MINSWKTVPLIALADYINGYAFKPEDHTDEGLPIIRIEQLKDDNAELDHYDKSVPEYNLIHNGDLIFSWSASLFLRIWDRGDAILNQHLFKVIPYPDVDKQYLKYCIEYNLPKLSNSSHGSTMKHITRKELKRFHVSLPSEKKEQAKIAEVLATIDRAIAQTGALIAKHQRIKTGLMQDLLTRGIDEHGQLRDPSTHRFKSTPLGMIPEEWEVSTLEQKCERVTDGAHASFPKNEGEIPFLFVSCIRNGQIYWDQASTISEQVYEIISKGKEPKKGLVLYTIVGSYGFAAVVEDNRRFSFQRHIGYLLPKETELSSHFLATWLNSEYGKRFADLFAMGNAQKTIILRDLKLFPLPVPSLPEQERINEILKKTDLEIDNLKKQQIKYEAMKTGLMQDLLSGRVSVKVLMEE